jgi:hypothetical protein
MPGSLLMMNAEGDTVVPAECARKLARAVPGTEHIWFPGTHYSIILFLPEALKRTGDFLKLPAGSVPNN